MFVATHIDHVFTFRQEQPPKTPITPSVSKLAMAGQMAVFFENRSGADVQVRSTGSAENAGR
ncbi:hypothetical protein CK224_30390 [Mesorhizobium sp. WSM3862]|nr:hypothetical protein CK224_30390 [Mesorhizobium sp. WSM3862]